MNNGPYREPAEHPANAVRRDIISMLAKLAVECGLILVGFWGGMEYARTPVPPVDAATAYCTNACDVIELDLIGVRHEHDLLNEECFDPDPEIDCICGNPRRVVTLWPTGETAVEDIVHDTCNEDRE